MKYKILKLASDFAILLGLAFVFYAVGGIECDTFTIREGMIKAAWAAGAIVLGLLTKLYLDKKGV